MHKRAARDDGSYRAPPESILIDQPPRNDDANPFHPLLFLTIVLSPVLLSALVVWIVLRSF